MINWIISSPFVILTNDFSLNLVYNSDFLLSMAFKTLHDAIMSISLTHLLIFSLASSAPATSPPFNSLNTADLSLPQSLGTYFFFLEHSYSRTVHDCLLLDIQASAPMLFSQRDNLFMTERSFTYLFFPSVTISLVSCLNFLSIYHVLGTNFMSYIQISEKW